jgi:hypothetical protein
MAGLRLIFSAAEGQFAEAFAAIRQPIGLAARAAIVDAGAQALAEGRAQIASAGFSTRWQNTLRARVYPDHAAAAIDAAVVIRHKIDYAGIFERGGRITGKPWLWLPLPAAPPRIGNRRITPAIYEQMIGPLHLITPRGRHPMLAAYVLGQPGKKPSLSKLRAGGALARLGARAQRGTGRRAGIVSLPMFVRVSTVTLRKRFDLAAVFARAHAGLGANYLRHLNQG